MANILALQQAVADGINDNNVKAANAQQIATLQAQLAAAAQPGWTTVANIERLTNWEIPPLVGNQAGVSSPGVFTFTPGTATAPAVFTAAGKGPWANGYFVTRFGDHSAATRFRRTLQFMFPTQADLDACQAFEIDNQQSTGKMAYNWALQFDFKGSHLVRVFNKATNPQVWEPTMIPVNIKAGVWNTVYLEAYRTDTVMTHIGVQINGVWTLLLMNHLGWAVNGAPYLNAGIQLDSNGLATPTPYRVLVQNDCPGWA
jgi:hypothetical protein